MQKPVHFVWYDHALEILNPPAKLKAALHYVKNSLQPDPKAPWQRIKVKEKICMFNPIPPEQMVGLPNDEGIVTYQGFKDKALGICQELGIDVKVHDMRLNFPEPNLRAMHSFRHSQQELLTRFLTMNQSGLLAAPTRYGKSYLIINTLRAYKGVNTVVTVPGEDLYGQLYDEIREALPDREVKLLGGGSRAKYPSEDITVCSMDSLHKCDHGAVRLLLIDEPHSAVTDARMPEFGKFELARRLGFGATVSGRFDNADVLIEGLIGPVLAERTYTDAVAEGAIAQIEVLMLKVRFPKMFLATRDLAYKRLLFENDDMARTVRWLMQDVIPADWQTLAFIQNEKQADYYKDILGGQAEVAMAKKMSSAERKAMTKAVKANEIMRCLASGIYAQGVTFPKIRVMINCCGGGGGISSVQRPGRLAQLQPGKRCGVVFDFLFECDQEAGEDKRGTGWMSLVGESWARHRIYKSKGYHVHICENKEELVKKFKEVAL